MELYTNALIQRLQGEAGDRVSSGAAATQLSPVSGSDAYTAAIDSTAQVGNASGLEHGGGGLDRAGGGDKDLGGRGGGADRRSGDKLSRGNVHW